MIFKALKTNFYNGSGTLKNKLKIEENSNYLQLTNLQFVLLRVDFNHGYKITFPFVPLFSILSSALEAS